MSDPYIEALVERVAAALILADDGGNPTAILSATKHSGDCTEGAWTCALCQAVEYRYSARAALSAVLDGIREGDEQSLRLACGYSDFCMPDGLDQSPAAYLREMRSAWTGAIDNLRQRNG
jgi:hypothetical protein